MDRRRREGIAADAHDRLDRALVLDALVHTRGNLSEAARVLGMNRYTVRRVQEELLEEGGQIPAPEEHTFTTRPEGAPWV